MFLYCNTCPCCNYFNVNIFPQGKVYVMYIGMEEVHDYKHWMKLATVSCTLDHSRLRSLYSIIYIMVSLQCIKVCIIILTMSHYSVFTYGTLMPEDSTKLVE